MIVVNGCPKSGTHAVMALLSTMGLKRMPGTIIPVSFGSRDYLIVSGMEHVTIDALRAVPDNVYILAHVPASYSLNEFRVITVFRDPRDCLVSYCRHRKREDGLDVSIPQALEDYWGAPFIGTYRGYLGWAHNCVRLRYEDLDPLTIGAGQGIYPQGKDFNTRTGKPSRWKEWWDEEAQAAWIRNGGLSLLHEAGYATGVR